ncbi:50S ribosomal protein L18 [Vitis vinifera]|uniref:50S ribosomal protein L18 n=1 Tax=Vitis vinifera TaxID=29760 RepID=A0A438IMA4_VITVI|nr:50S ribosomal protein L18 [Vitis vinifera]
MVIPPPVKPPRIMKFLKPYVLKMHFTNKFVNAQVIHSPTATVASAASSQEKTLRSTMESTRDVAAAAMIGKILGERLLLQDIPAVTVFLKRDQKYHGKVKAVIDSLREVEGNIWAIPLYLPIPLECPGGPAENRPKGLSGFINALSLFLDPDL